MKHSLLEVIICPTCGGSLSVRDSVMRSGEVYEGALKCALCPAGYPIARYVPRFVQKDNYSHSWGKLWEETGAILRDSHTGIPFHENIVHGQPSESGNALEGTSPFGFSWPRDLAGQRVLEIGPGTGNCTEILVKTGADLLCVDMSHAIDTFPEDLLTRPNINVIQADITSGVVKNGQFDRIWLFQVLQHTPSPPDTLSFVRHFLKPQGELAVTSYARSFDPWYYRYTKRIDDRLAWKLVSTLTPLGVRLKRVLRRALRAARLRRLERIVAAGLGFFDPRDIYAQTLDGKMDDYLMGRIWRDTRDRKLLMKHVIVNTYDAITPTYTNSCEDLATMERWLRDAGYSRWQTWGKAGVRAKAWS